MKTKTNPYQRNPLDDLPRFSYAGCIPPQDSRGPSLRTVLALSALALLAGWYGFGFLLSVAQ